LFHARGRGISPRHRVPCTIVAGQSVVALQRVKIDVCMCKSLENSAIFNVAMTQRCNTSTRCQNTMSNHVDQTDSSYVVPIPIMNLTRTKCLPILLYAVESCQLVIRDKRSLEFTVTRSLMKLFKTGSAAVISDCQKFFELLPVTYKSIYIYNFIHHQW